MSSKKTGPRTAGRSLTIIVIIAVLLIVVFLVHKYIPPKDDPSNGNDDPGQDIGDPFSEEELLAYVPFNWPASGMPPSVYIDRKVTVQDLGEASFLISVMRICEQQGMSFYDDSVTEEEAKEAFGDQYYLITGDHHNILVSDLRQVAEEAYNVADLQIPGSFSHPAGPATVYQDKIYIYHGMGIADVERVTVEYNFETDGDELYIFEKIILMEWDYENSAINLFTDESSASFASVDSSDIYSLDQVDVSPYLDSLKTFKHTYRKGASGKFYWYSTEPV